MSDIKNNEIYFFFHKLGFTNTEVLIYLKLLELGLSTVTDLSRKLKIPRTNTHRYIERLIEKGFVSQSLKSKVRELMPEDPVKLNLILREQELEMSDSLGNIKELQTNVPNIINLIHTSIPKENNPMIGIKYYEGKKGVQLIYQEAFQSNELRSYVNLGETHKVFPKNDILFLEAQKINRSRLIREIIDESEESFEKASKYEKKPNFHFKRSSIPTNLSSINILMFDNKVATINFKNNVFGSVLLNKDYYENSTAIFDYLWENLS